MKEFLKKNKYYIFPAFIIICVVILSLLRLNGSSVAMYYKFLNQDITNDRNLLLGVPRAVRSDQYIGGIPTYSSQNHNDEATINPDIGEGMRMETQNVPTKTPFSIFRPTNFFFYVSNDTELSYSFYWWSEMGLMIICLYLLLLEIINKNLFISILGSSILFLTPFFHWWNQFSCITWISLGIFFYLKIIKEEKLLKMGLYGIGFTYSLICFALILYPPFQIPLAYVALSIGIASIITNWKNIKTNWKYILPIIIVSVFTTILCVLLFFNTYKEVIEITTNTVYPGARFVQAGTGNLFHLFDGVFNLLLQKDSNIAPFGNQSESSNFFLLFPPLLIWVLFKNTFNYIKTKKVDILGIFLSFCLIFFLVFYLIPLPDVFSKYFLFYMVPPQRSFIGFGFTSYLLIFHYISNFQFYKDHKKIEKVSILLLSLLFGIFTFFVGKNLFQISPDFFKNPTIISPEQKILLMSIFSVILIYLMIKGFKKYFLLFLLFFSFVSTILINPLYKGLKPLLSTDLAIYIQEISKYDTSKWVGYNSLALSQYALANDASIINGAHTYPQFEIWRQIDSKEEYKDIYNRFAYVLVSEKEINEEKITLIAPDTVEINMDACNPIWNSLNVKHIISNGEIDGPCLELKKKFEKYNVFIYEIN